MAANAPALLPTDAVSGLPMRWPTMRERSCMSAQLVSPAASNRAIKREIVFTQRIAS
jgi:hypothetical protein